MQGSEDDSRLRRYKETVQSIVKAAMKSAGKADALANLLSDELGYRPQANTIYSWSKRGGSNPTAYELLAIARVSGQSVDFFMNQQTQEDRLRVLEDEVSELRRMVEQREQSDDKS